MRSILKFLCWFLVLALLFAGGAAIAWHAGPLGKTYTATATLELARCEPHILTEMREKFDPVEFESFRDTQMSLIRSRFVILAALRDPRLKDRACVARQEARRATISWLTDAIRVEFPAKNSSIMLVKASQPDPEDAAAIVNAVVEAYMNEVVNYERQWRRERLADLQHMAAEKENEVRTKREELKRELENIGAGDLQMAMSAHAGKQRELERMREWHRLLRSQLDEAKGMQAETLNAEGPEIAELEVARILFGNPTYRDLYARWMSAEIKRSQNDRNDKPDVAPSEKAAAETERARSEQDAIKRMLDRLEAEARQQIREARRIELTQEVRRLERQSESLASQLTAMQKEVERKASEVNELNRTSVSVQMFRTELDSLTRILGSLNDERERLRVELKALPRVRVLGDPSAPAAVPEKPD